MLLNRKAVIFDLDGTLIDSMWLWKEIDIEYLGRFGISLPDNLQRNIEGKSFSETAQYFKEHFPIPDSIDEMKATWNRMAWDKYANEVFLKQGVKELLEYLKGQHVKLGIATSNSKELVNLVMENLDVVHYFDSVRTSCEVEKGKPYPDIYQLVASDLHVRPQECLVFEDVVQGIMAGKNAGMSVCAVYDEASASEDEQKRELADYYIRSYNELVF